MDHSHMDQGSMGHSGSSSGPQCSMNMLFTWDTTDLCLVFPQWRVDGPWSLLLSLLGVVALSAGYELVRDLTRRYEAASVEYLNALPRQSAAPAVRRSKIIKASLYAVQVFYSFFVMLLFMTYNGWVMICVAIGAFVGYLAFGEGSACKSVACH